MLWCCGCLTSKPEAAYSKRQLKKSGARRCHVCVDNGTTDFTHSNAANQEAHARAANLHVDSSEFVATLNGASETLGNYLRGSAAVAHNSASTSEQKISLDAMLNVFNGTEADPREPAGAGFTEWARLSFSGDAVLKELISIWSALFQEAFHTGELAHTPRALTRRDMGGLIIMAAHQPVICHGFEPFFSLLHPEPRLTRAMRAWEGNPLPIDLELGCRVHLAQPGWANAAGADLHWAFCRPVFLSSFGPYMGLSDGTIDIFENTGHNVAFVFEDSKCANAYLRRSRRVLAENQAFAASAKDQILEEERSPEDESAPQFGDESHLHVHLSATSFASDTSVMLPTTMLMLIRVKNVVTKVCMSSETRTVEEVRTKMYQLAKHVADRLQQWSEAFTPLCAKVSTRLPNHLRILQEAILQGFRVRARLTLERTSSAKSVGKVTRTCASCGRDEGALRRCNGCWRLHFCSAECQKLSWESGHKDACSREFELRQR